MKPKYKDYRIHTSLIEEKIKEGKRKERPKADNPNRYENEYLLGPNLSIIVKRLLPVEDIQRLYSYRLQTISQVNYYSKLISIGAGFEIQNGDITEQYFEDNLTILYNAKKLDIVATLQFFYDNSAKVSYSRNISLGAFEFKNEEDSRSKIGKYSPHLIYNVLFDMLEKEKKESNYYRWRKGLGFGFNKQRI